MRKLPLYGWIGLLVIALSEAGMLARIEPFYHWHTPIAWTGYILLVDAIVWKRRGSSWLRNHPAELFFLAWASVPLWVIFEMYNKFVIHNWYYVGLPDDLMLRYFGYAWSFATIWPAMFETGDADLQPARPACAGQPRRRAAAPSAPARGMDLHGGRRAHARRPDPPARDAARDVPRGAGVAGVHPAPRSAERTSRRGSRSWATGAKGARRGRSTCSRPGWSAGCCGNSGTTGRAPNGSTTCRFCPTSSSSRCRLPASRAFPPSRWNAS